MTHPLVLAELKSRAAALELQAEKLNYRVPGESVSIASSRRRMEHNRARAMAQDYRTLIELAERA